MVAPLAFAAPLVLAPLMAAASGIIGTVIALALAAAGVLVLFEVLKAVSKHVPGLRLLVPQEHTEAERAERRAEADLRAKEVVLQIEAEIQEAAEAERRARQPKSLEEAQARLVLAVQALGEARAALADAEDAAKVRSGGWHAVCEAREALARTAAWEADARAEAEAIAADGACAVPHAGSATGSAAGAAGAAPGDMPGMPGVDRLPAAASPALAMPPSAAGFTASRPATPWPAQLAFNSCPGGPAAWPFAPPLRLPRHTLPIAQVGDWPASRCQPSPAALQALHGLRSRAPTPWHRAGALQAAVLRRL